MNFKDLVKEHLAKGDTDKAIKVLVEATKDENSPLHDQAVLLSGQYRQWKREMTLGVQQSSSDLRRIEMGIMNLLSGKPEDFEETPVNSNVSKSVNIQKTAPTQAHQKSNTLGIIAGVLGLAVIGLMAWMFVGGSHADEHPPHDHPTEIPTDQTNTGNENSGEGQNPTFVDNDENPETPEIEPEPEPEPEAPQVGEPVFTNQNINLVEMGNNQGNTLGYFKQTTIQNWTELDENKTEKFRFIELSRDANSILLKRAESDMKVRLDIKNSNIMLLQDGSEGKLYSILKSESVRNALVATKVHFKDVNGVPVGVFEQVQGTKTWQEKNKPSGTVAFTFEERNRDEWTIYLFDASINKTINLDLYKKSVEYGMNGQELKEIYKIGMVE